MKRLITFNKIRDCLNFNILVNKMYNIGKVVFRHFNEKLYPFDRCELTTGKGWQSSISSWAKTFFLTSPWNWISPQKLGNTSQTINVSFIHLVLEPYLMFAFINERETYTAMQADSF